MKGGSNDTSKCTVQAKHGRNGKVVFANLPRLGYSLAYASGTNYGQFLLFAGSTKSTAILYEHFKHLKLNNFRNKLYLSMTISVYKKISYCL